MFLPTLVHLAQANRSTSLDLGISELSIQDSKTAVKYDLSKV